MAKANTPEWPVAAEITRSGAAGDAALRDFNEAKEFPGAGSSLPKREPVRVGRSKGRLPGRVLGSLTGAGFLGEGLHEGNTFAQVIIPHGTSGTNNP